jgi:hypothetical protein
VEIITWYSLEIIKAPQMRLTKDSSELVFGACVIMLSAVVSVFAWAQLQKPLVVEDAEVSISLSGERIYQGKPLTGEAVTFHANGQLATSDQFVEGRRNGYARSWFENGVMGYEAHYYAELKDGISRTWWSNGTQRSEVVFADGLQEGEGWYWYRSGAKFKKSNHLAGQPVGIQQAWRENGELFSNFEYKNGRIFGLRKSNTCVGLEDEQISPEYYHEQAG